jgi:hypothetical protein
MFKVLPVHLRLYLKADKTKRLRQALQGHRGARINHNKENLVNSEEQDNAEHSGNKAVKLTHKGHRGDSEQL